MAIYRGIGSAVTTTDQATIDQVSQDASDANVSATNAASSASSASGSASAAASSASAASTSETNAAASETAAAASETAAAASETAAAASETAAAASETAAAASETAAAASETAAAASETAAGTSETNAAASATAAASSASAASTSASNASTSETNAAASESAAASSASAAQAAEDAALAALDSFDDRYLGTKTSAPTVDNDGNALVAGALYFNTTTNEMKVYDGSQWLNAYASLSGALIATSNLSDLNDAATARTNLGLGTAATTASTDYATAAQGALADSALQSFTETDPVYTASSWYTTTNNSANWDTAYGWGDHGAAGYLTGNQTISLSGDASGSGTTSITVVVADDSHNHSTSTITGLGSLATLSTVDASTITDNSVGAAELNVTGNGTSGQMLTSDGDGTFSWDDAPEAFASGTKMIFAQASAPTGWTQDTSSNDAALRVVSGTGGGTGGTANFSSPAHSLSAGNTTLSTTQIPAHTHGVHIGNGYYNSCLPVGQQIATCTYSNRQCDTKQSYSTGGGSSHGHSLSGSITTPKYKDVIIATKD